MSALNHKPNEAGWFYHAPTKKQTDRPPVGAPPPSQIPGLGQVEQLEPQKPREMVFRETDTKYVQMAKMGGRKDLLAIKPNSENKQEPVPYPRCEWYYLEDNAVADKSKENIKWQFLLPDYMVHHPYRPHGDGDGNVEAKEGVTSVPMRRAPYATENQSSFHQDGHSLTDKTVALPEIRRPGYGVRSAKQASSKHQPPVVKSKPLSSQVQEDRPRLTYQPLSTQKQSETTMSKLLSNSYQREWHEEVQQWSAKQGGPQEKYYNLVKGEMPKQTEYNTKYNHFASSTQKSSGRRNASDKISPKDPQSSNKNKEAQPEKELFKLSKFKNVPARIDTHQSPEVLAAVGH